MFRRTLPLLLAAPALAQPRGPLRILVGFPPGGTIDAVARMLAEQWGREFGSVVVENRPGAGGQLAAQALRQAAPDGRTILLSPDHSMVLLPLTIRTPGYAVAEFQPLGMVAVYAGGFAVGRDVPANTMQEFLAWARANPARANVGIPAPGSVPQFINFLLSQRAGAALASVPYRGSAPLVQDMLGGQVAAGSTALGDFLEHHQSGALRVIGVLGREREAILPGVPSFTEQGLDIVWDYWLGLFAQAGLPRAEAARFNTAINAALARPDIAERMRRIVFEPAPGPAEALGARVARDTAFWAPVVRDSGWQLQ